MGMDCRKVVPKNSETSAKDIRGRSILVVGDKLAKEIRLLETCCSRRTGRRIYWNNNNLKLLAALQGACQAVTAEVVFCLVGGGEKIIFASTTYKRTDYFSLLLPDANCKAGVA